MATIDQPLPTSPNPIDRQDWQQLADALHLPDTNAAMERAFEIAKYVAEVENDPDSKLLVKSGNKYYNLSLANGRR